MPVGAVLEPALVQMPGRIIVQILIVLILPGFCRIHIDLQRIVIVLQPPVNGLKELNGWPEREFFFQLFQRTVEQIIEIETALVRLRDKVLKAFLWKISPGHDCLCEVNV